MTGSFKPESEPENLAEFERSEPVRSALNRVSPNQPAMDRPFNQTDKMEEKYAMSFYEGFEKRAASSTVLRKSFLKGLLDVNEFTPEQYSRALGNLARKAIIGGAVGTGAMVFERTRRERMAAKKAKMSMEKKSDVKNSFNPLANYSF